MTSLRKRQRDGGHEGVTREEEQEYADALKAVLDEGKSGCISSVRVSRVVSD